MLSRIKRRGPSSSFTPGSAGLDSEHAGPDGNELDTAPTSSPGPSTGQTPSSVYLAPQQHSPTSQRSSTRSGRTSSPSRVRTASFGSFVARPVVPISDSQPGNGSIKASDSIGYGSLSLEHLGNHDGAATLIVQAPELQALADDGLPRSDSINSVDARTPVPADLHAASNQLSRAPRSRSTSSAVAPPRDGLDALRDTVPIALEDSAALTEYAVRSSPSHSRPSSRPVSRSGSRSSSITSQQKPDGHALRPPSVNTSTNGAKTLARTPSAASALAASLGNTAPATQRSAGMERSATQTSLPRSSFESQFESRGGAGEIPARLSLDAMSDLDDVASQLGTGYAVASSKRNADFHAIFKSIPDDDYLIEDYGCALQREILIQGRLYISEHHLSFNANIFGWVTTLIIPFAEVVSIEKRMTAYVIPNAVQVTTLHARHVFASFLSRDSTYNLIGSIWRMVHPVVPPSAALPDTTANRDLSDGHDSDSDESQDETSPAAAPKRARRRLRGLRRRDGGAEAASGETGPDRGLNGSPRPHTRDVIKFHPVTTDTCPLLPNLKEVCMDTVFPSSPEKIYNLMFTSGFMKEFWADNQKLTEIELGDWAPQASGSNLLGRSVSYIKPLTAPIGPKQTKCVITDENAHVDFDDYVCVITTTRTPDVPSGTAFAVKTRTSMTWARNNSCRVRVTTGVEWSKSSFIKGIVEKSCIEGQKTYHTDLELAMRNYIQQHRSEFMDQDANAADLTTGEIETLEEPDKGQDALNDQSRADSREVHPLLQLLRSAGSAWVDLTGASSPVNAGLTFVVVVLILSNLWTLASRPSASPRTPSLANDAYATRQVVERTPDDVALAVRQVLRDYFSQQTVATSAHAGPSDTTSTQGEDQAHLQAMKDTVRDLEARLAQLRAELDTVKRSR
ncbi:hypothetical protein ACM66B_001280 [Microbotryomycetes sp. NB124-2]